MTPTPPAETIDAQFRDAFPALDAAEWHAVLDAVDDAIFLHDAETGAILDANRAACELYGWSPEEFRRLAVEDISSGEPPYTQEEAREWVRRAAGEGPQRFEWLCRDRRGRLFWSEVSLRRAHVRSQPRVVASVRDISGRKAAQEALRESEERFQGAFRNAGIGMAICSTQGEFLQVNQALCDLLGYTEAELQGLTFLDVTHPEDREASLANVRRLQAGELPTYQMEKRYLAKSGRVVWATVAVSGVRDAAGRILYEVCQVVDVTERLRTTEELRDSERRYRNLVETMSDGLVVRDPENVIVYANPRFGEILGVPHRELVGRHLDELHDEENRRLYRARVAKRPSGDRESYILTWLAPDGRGVETRLAPCPLFGEDGSFRGSFAVVTDLTAQRQAEAHLRETQERFRKIADASRDMIHLNDREGRILFANPATERLLGYPADELIGLPALELVHPEDRERVRDDMGAHYAGEDAPPIGIRLLKRGGGVLPVEVSGFRIADRDGDYYLGAILRDTSERQAAEQERAALERELERSRSLEAIGRLAGGVAHDFNNLLGSVLGCVYVARLAKGDPSVSDEELARIEGLCKRGGDLTRQLLTVARRQSGAVEQVEVGPLLQELRGLLTHTLPKDIRLEVSVDPGLPRVRAEGALLTTGLLNLALNARDAMPEGGLLSIRAARRRDKRGGEWVDLAVTDTGVGVPEEVRDLIFHPFFTTKEVGKGNGLGLSTAQAAVRAWGGKLVVESAAGRGSTFAICLPAAEGHAESKTQPAPPGDIAHPLTRSQLLVVEDEEDVARLMVRVLNDRGYEVTRASTGLEALERLRERRGDFGLVVLDLVLPEWGGEGVYRLLRGLVPEVPVLLVSGREDLARGLAPQGPRLTKPFTAAEFLDAVAGALRGAP